MLPNDHLLPVSRQCKTCCARRPRPCRTSRRLTLTLPLPLPLTLTLALTLTLTLTLTRCAEKGLVSVAAPGFQSPGVVVVHTEDSGVVGKFIAAGTQIAAGVPFMIGEPEGTTTFRIGHLSLYLPVPPCISLYLPSSPCIS